MYVTTGAVMPEQGPQGELQNATHNYLGTIDGSYSYCT